MRIIVVLTVLIFCIGSPLLEPSAAGVPRTIVIEEFGATWCTFCPNARCAMETMDSEFGDAIVHFENHIFDSLEIPKTQERAGIYGITGVPHVRTDGLDPYVGAPTCETAEVEIRSRIEARLAATGGMSPIEITGSYSLNATELSIEAVYRLVDPEALTDLRATLLVYEDNVFWCCGYDDVDTWQHVTRVIYDESIVLAQVDDEAPVMTTIMLDSTWDPAELHVVAYVQTTSGTREIIQGLGIDADPADVADLEGGAPTFRIDAVRPNPFRSTTEIAFTLSPEAAAHPIRLEILDVAGRRVAVLEEARTSPGHHVRRWDGAAGSSGRVGNGVYFARLTTALGVERARLILLE